MYLVSQAGGVWPVAGAISYPMRSNAVIRPLNHAWKLHLTPLIRKISRLRRALRPLKFSKNPLKPLLFETTPPPPGGDMVTARATSEPCFLSGLTPMGQAHGRGMGTRSGDPLPNQQSPRSNCHPLPPCGAPMPCAAGSS